MHLERLINAVVCTLRPIVLPLQDIVARLDLDELVLLFLDHEFDCVLLLLTLPDFLLHFHDGFFELLVCKCIEVDFLLWLLLVRKFFDYLPFLLWPCSFVG